MAKRFTEHYLLPFIHDDLQWLINIMHQIVDFSHLSIEFHHVLSISQQLSELTLCTSLLQTHFTDDWVKVDSVMCCEVSSFVYVSALISQINLPLMLICEAGKLLSLTVSVIKPLLHISSLASNNSKEKWIEMKWDVILRNVSVMMIDNVLFTEKTLCAVLQLLDEASISVENVSIMIVTEFSVHHGWKLLRQCEFGRINIQSLLIFDDD